jgi:hypothetical protein
MKHEPKRERRKYLVRVADRKTGEESTLTVDAVDEKHAEAIAVDQGLLVNNVCEVIPESPPEPEPPKPTKRYCQYCIGEIDPSARKCRHCGEWLKSVSFVDDAGMILSALAQVALVLIAFFLFWLSYKVFGDAQTIMHEIEATLIAIGGLLLMIMAEIMALYNVIRKARGMQ